MPSVAKCRFLFVVKLSVIMLSVAFFVAVMQCHYAESHILFVVMLSVIMVNVVAPPRSASLSWALSSSTRPGNTKGGSNTVPLTSCLTGLICLFCK
jgi:hypothetical protein